MLIGNLTFSFKKTHLKMSSGKWRPFCLDLNVLKIYQITPIFSTTLAQTMVFCCTRSMPLTDPMLRCRARCLPWVCICLYLYMSVHAHTHARVYIFTHVCMCGRLWEYTYMRKSSWSSVYQMCTCHRPVLPWNINNMLTLIIIAALIRHRQAYQ